MISLIRRSDVNNGAKEKVLKIIVFETLICQSCLPL